MAKIIKDDDKIKQEKLQQKLEKKQLKKAKKEEKKNKDKKDVPVLKNPTETRIGRIIVWILLILMGLGGLGTVIFLIYKLITRG